MGKNIVATFYMVIGLSLLMGTADAVNKTNADWYLHMNIKAIKNGPLKELIQQRTADNNVDKILNTIFGKNIKDELEKFTIYGAHTGFKDFTLILQGDFSDKARKDFLSKMKAGKNHSTKKIAGQKLHHWSFDGYQSGDGDDFNINVADKPIELFATELNHRAFVISRDENEIKAWLNGKYNLQEFDRKGVFEVVVNLQNTLAHGGFNFGKEQIDLGFDSSVMKKVLQFSFSVSDRGENTAIEIGLVTKDKQIANQLKNIVNGLIALQAMVGDMDEDIKAFVNNLSIEVKGVNVLLKSSISTAELKTLTD